MCPASGKKILSGLVIVTSWSPTRMISSRLAMADTIRRAAMMARPTSEVPLQLERPDPACLVIADISGYTSYLAGVELDHAQDILADLTDVVVRTLRPTFRLAKLEGDAAFAYAIAPEIDGSALQDTIERCYYAFRRRLRDIGQASQCECNACILIPRLDLKFVVHHGLIARQRMAGREELVGREVIVVHRLLKNTVQESLGLGAYALYTAGVRRAMDLADPERGRPARAHRDLRHRRARSGAGSATWRQPGPRRSRARRWRSGTDEAAWSTTYELPAPPDCGMGVDDIAGPADDLAARPDRVRRGDGRRAAWRRDDESLHPRQGRGRGGGPGLAATRAAHGQAPGPVPRCPQVHR